MKTPFTFMLALSLSACSGPAQKPSLSRPNILFILTDDQRWDALGCFGNASIRTPHLDRLASQGIRLDAFYPAAPLCCPSRAAFLSGRYPHQNGVLNNAPVRDGRRFPDETVDLDAGSDTLATRLNAAGYRTGFVGKSHLGGDPRKWGFQECPLWFPGGATRHKEARLLREGKPWMSDKPITVAFADAAIRYLESRRAGEPWMLWLATTAPHAPYLHDPKHPYKVQDLSPPPGWPRNQAFPSDADWAGYYSTISMMDEQIGRVLDRLDDLGLAENTFVFMASDNGFMMGSHGHKAKQVWFEESARTPALARWPGHIRPGDAVSAPVVGVDLLPSVLALAGAAPAPGLEGRSMIPALTGGKPLREAAFAEVQMGGVNDVEPGDFWQMIRDGRWKYVRSRDATEHLYDLESDRNELKDLVSDPAFAGTLDRLRIRLDEWLRATPARSPD